MSPTDIVAQLVRWMPPTAELDQDNPLFVAGYVRNIQRHAQDVGPELVAMLVKSGALAPDQSPTEALEQLIAKAGA